MSRFWFMQIQKFTPSLETQWNGKKDETEKYKNI